MFVHVRYPGSPARYIYGLHDVPTRYVYGLLDIAATRFVYSRLSSCLVSHRTVADCSLPLLCTHTYTHACISRWRCQATSMAINVRNQSMYVGGAARLLPSQSRESRGRIVSGGPCMYTCVHTCIYLHVHDHRQIFGNDSPTLRMLTCTVLARSCCSQGMQAMICVVARACRPRSALSPAARLEL